MANVLVEAGLAYGDEGKGTVIDAMSVKFGAKLVVRYNGGAQCGHNVVTADGRHHTFSQFGSGTLQGVPTHLSRFMLMNPIFLRAEAKHLEQVGVRDPMKLLTIEADAPVTTPYHVAANRLREILRSNGRHGSCGLGVGETAKDVLANNFIRVGDLQNRALTRKKLWEVTQRKREEFADLDRSGWGESALREWSILEDPRVEDVLEMYAEFAHEARIVNDEWLTKMLKGDGTILFEGAQGMLLDQDYGWHPYTTWSDITFANAYKLLEGTNVTPFRLGVTRTNMTRHGAGPFITESHDPVPFKDHNCYNPWQQNFRHGHFDAEALRYAIRMLGGVDGIALTRLDDLGSTWRVCTSYEGIELPREKPPAYNNWKFCEKLTEKMVNGSVKPHYEDLDAKIAPVGVSTLLGARVVVTSQGPTANDKTFPQGGLRLF